ncbi:CLUMA_CG004167, isoform A [Clunio marinus]|uniref:CLUMA_CG004167, isoform A n=1 Tax=Clunio marinus TaxID=568069 RepID=A0A1J1HWL0_9DIPT|nr:CLUMA_CG004167, isoform A [Clunio marinus]
MGVVTWCFVALSLLRIFVDSKSIGCEVPSTEKRFIENFNKLLDQKSFRIVEGISMKKRDDFKLAFNRTEESKTQKCDDLSQTLITETKERLKQVINTHVLEFDLAKLFIEDNASTSSAPRRRRKHQAVSMVLMGITVFLMVFVPMGFQFLAALGGKAFLMAKLALLLASVNGLKRVANSGVHYGLYHSLPEPGLHHHPYGYDRNDGPRMSLK